MQKKARKWSKIGPMNLIKTETGTEDDKPKCLFMLKIEMVAPRRIELRTRGFSVPCSTN